VREVVREAGADKIGRLAASLAYFAVFAMPGLLAMVIAAAGAVWGFEAVQRRVLHEMRGLVGEEGGRAVQAMVATAMQPKGSSFATQAVAIGGLVFGASGFFLQLQDALNTMWGAKGNEKRKGVLHLVLKRLLSLGMVLSLAVLLLVSLALSAMLSAFGDAVGGWIGADVTSGFLAVVQFAISFAMVTLLFAALYKAMPDLKIEWREVWVGAAATSLLFVAGKLAIGFYLGKSDPGSAYGAAGPLVVILLWVYYTSLVVLVGAEFTQVYARLHGPRKAERRERMAAKAGKDPDVSPEKGPAPRKAKKG
jgi:membrane protein